MNIWTSNKKFNAARKAGNLAAKFPGIDFEAGKIDDKWTVCAALPEWFVEIEAVRLAGVNITILPAPASATRQWGDVCNSREAALATATEHFGKDTFEGIDFIVHRTARGEFMWITRETAKEWGVPFGPSTNAWASLASPSRLAISRPSAPAAAGKPASAPAGRPKPKYAAQWAAAAAGTLPEAPVLTGAESIRRFGAAIANLVALAQAGNIAGLEAVAIKPVATYQKIMLRYRDMAVMALNAKKAKA